MYHTIKSARQVRKYHEPTYALNDSPDPKSFGGLRRPETDGMGKMCNPAIPLA
jgi:hypothetical protein